MNSVRSEAPSTISGVDIGRKISTFVAPRPRKSWRTSASAISVPSTVATSVEMSADLERLDRPRRGVPGMASQFIQLSSVKPCQT